MTRVGFFLFLVSCQNTVLRSTSGLSVSLTATQSYAVLGQSFRFTCTVTDEENIALGSVGFSKKGTTASCAVVPSTCAEYSSADGYSCWCVSNQTHVYYMDITSVSQQDETTWRCTRRSTNSNNFLLPVYYGPDEVTLDKSSPQTVTEFSSLTVVCSSSCKPCSFTWRKGTTTVSTSGILSLTNINRNQAGDYICTATNTGITGSTPRSSTLTVDVQYPPEVRLDTSPGPSSCRPFIVSVGQQNVQLTCRVTTANPSTGISYIWTHSGSTISSATGSVYSLSPVTTSSGGRYTCAGRNSAGTSSSQSSVQVDVQYAPSVSLPSSWTVIEGQTLTVTCSVDSKPTASVSWTRKDGGSFTPQTGSTLTISNIQQSQTGSYVCTATNTLSPCGGTSVQRTDTAEVTVDVQYKPAISGQAPSYNVTELSLLRINCSMYTTLGKPRTTSYTWTGPNSYSSTGPVLSISSINRTQTGQYICTATNTLTPTGGPSQSGTVSGHFQVDVQYPTVITSYTINSNTNTVTVSEASNLSMKCQVDSNPGSTIRLKNGTQEISVVEDSLTNEYSWKADCRQRGNYSCTAGNSIGGSDVFTRNIQLFVMCSPRLDETSLTTQLFASSVGSDISLSVTFLSYPDPNFVWSQTNDSTQRNLSSQSRTSHISDISVTASLTLTNLQEDDFGEYMVQADNGVGQSTSTTLKLVPQGPPNTPTNLTILDRNTHSLQVAWKQEFNGGGSQTFLLQYSVDDLSWSDAITLKETRRGEYLQASITGLTPETVYYVRVGAKNQYGTTYTGSIRGLTLKEKSEPPPPAGLIVGITVSVLVLTVIVLSVIILRRKGFKCVLLKPGSTILTKEQRTSHTQVSHQRDENQASNTYSGLSNRTADQTYTELRTYVNTGTESAYEGLQTKNPTHYEDVKPSPYENTAFSRKDHTYVNT